MPSKINILLADDHELILSGLELLLGGDPRWKVVGLARNGREAVQMANRLQPHIAVLDITMPELNGIEAARQIRHASPATEILILSMHNSEAVVRDAVAAGAKGFILKTDTTRLLKSESARLDFDYEIRRESEAALLATGSTSQVFTTPTGELILNWPLFMLERLTSWESLWKQP